MTEAQFPEKLNFLFQSKRYKITYGGRGGAKSWGIARALLIKGAASMLRVACFRDIQKSISDSCHALLAKQIEFLGLSDFYDIQNTSIKGRNGTEFSFEGLRHNVSKIKSLEGVDIAWVEEAQTVTKNSWDVLIPTIRKEGSEIWVSFNPELDTDETFRRFVLNPPPGAQVVKVNWSDNPWFPKTLRDEKDHLRETDPDAYLTVWEGHCKQVLDGAIYAKELRTATEEGRITRVPYIPGKPVHTFWDLGWSDKTSIWFAQKDGLFVNVIDFYQDRLKDIPFYMKLLQGKPYVYGTDYLPHDAEAGTLANGGRGVDQQLRGAGRKVQIVPRVAKKLIGINATRSIFPLCRFDDTNTADGLNALRRYCYDVNPETQQWSREPKHDENSHAADAFETLARSLQDEKPSAKAKPKQQHYMQSNGWMG